MHKVEATWKMETLEYLKAVLDTSLSQEETREVIVPDAYPDMQAIVGIEGNVTLKSKEAGSGRVSVSGNVAANVLCLTEGGGALKSIELQIPFTIGHDAHEITDDAKLCVKAKLSSIDARMINSRKVLVRADIMVEVRAFERASLSHAIELDGEAESGLHIRKEHLEFRFVSQVCEKTFVLADEFAIPAGKAAIGEILKSHIRLHTDDIKNVGNKLIFKGAATVHLLYTSAQSGEQEALEFEAGFSQIVELESGGEDASYEIAIQLTNAYIESGMTENGGISLELHAVAQVIERRMKKLSYISDAYSTRFDLEIGKTEHTPESLDETEELQTEVRESIELPTGALRVIDFSVCTGRVQWNMEAGKLVSRVSVHLSVIYVSEDGELQGLARRFEAVAELDARENRAYTVTARGGRDVFVLQSADGLEVKLPLTFIISPTRKARFHAIDRLSWDAEAPRDLESLPSVTVYHADGGESLWHLAKRYASTEEQIMAANGVMEDAVPYPGQLFIIPKAR